MLVVDDDESIARLVGSYLRRLGFAADWALDEAAALAAAETRPYRLLVVDYQLPGVNGLELSQRLEHTQRGPLPIIVMTAHGDLDTCLKALRAGASDFLVKPFQLSLLAVVVTRVLMHHRVAAELSALRTELRLASEHHGLLGEHPAMQTLRGQLELLGASDSTVLVVGETGTGKELVARALHASSLRRSRGPFVAVNCAALPAGLIESELFGHAAGAFTDARLERRGLFREADGGTLFLDEVGELPLQVQGALLRAVAQRSVRPVGTNSEVPVDVRLVSATNRDLSADVARGAFRADLRFRLDAVRLEIPPLRDRASDVLLLWRHFLSLASARFNRHTPTTSTSVSEALLRYAWPGNVRELQNAVEQALVACEGERVELWHLPSSVVAPSVLAPAPGSQVGLVSLAELERLHVARVLGSVGGNRRRAAELLGIDRVTLYRKLKATGPGRSPGRRPRGSSERP